MPSLSKILISAAFWLLLWPGAVVALPPRRPAPAPPSPPPRPTAPKPLNQPKPLPRTSTSQNTFNPQRLNENTRPASSSTKPQTGGFVVKPIKSNAGTFSPQAAAPFSPQRLNENTRSASSSTKPQAAAPFVVKPMKKAVSFAPELERNAPKPRPEAGASTPFSPRPILKKDGGNVETGDQVGYTEVVGPPTTRNPTQKDRVEYSAIQGAHKQAPPVATAEKSGHGSSSQPQSQKGTGSTGESPLPKATKPKDTAKTLLGILRNPVGAAKKCFETACDKLFEPEDDQ